MPQQQAIVMIERAATITPDMSGLLLSLQHSDSFFPSGAMAFSWGLECLNRDALVSDDDTLSAYIEAQLLHRWLTFDQAILSAAWQASTSESHGGDLSATALQALADTDQLAEAMTLAPLMREGSQRLGLTLLNVHAKLGTRFAGELKSLFAATAPHLAVVQGCLWRSLGMSELQSRAVSAHTLCASATSAAIRLGLAGHLDAQRILTRMQSLIASMLTDAVPPLWQLSSSTLASDIASLRHGGLDARMFAN